VFTLVDLAVPSQGAITGAWTGVFRKGFGWGTVVVPVMMVASGLWLLLRSLGDRLPRPSAEQAIGVVMLYLALLVVMHYSLDLAGEPAGWQAGLEGRGGGLIGAALLSVMINAVGGIGTVVVLITWALIGVTLTIGLSIPEFIDLMGKGISWRRGRPRSAGVTTPEIPPATLLEGEGEVPRVPPAGEHHAAPAPRGAAPKPAAAPAVGFLGTRTEDTGTAAWVLPPWSEVLERGTEGKVDEAFDRERAKVIEETLLSFGAPAHVVEINRGPTITQFGVEPDFVEGRAGRRTKVKVSKISALADDLALALAASSIRVEAPVPGKGYVGIEVPNQQISLVALRDLMEAEAFKKLRSTLRLGLGRDVSGRPIAADLSAMPHLLIAGTTGSGKSVCVNAIVACLLLQNTPDDLKFVMVDPKRVELTFYNGIPHLLAPVVVELERVVPALQWVSREMDERYRRFSREGVRNIADFNERARQNQEKPLPYISVVIDELADLMMLAPDETERVITRLAQLARATGIHLIIATQRPSVDVVTGLIKANFPARIAFAVASSVDSRVILDQPGAERLLGRGDMLFQSPDAAAPIRMQGAYVSEVELTRLIMHWKGQAAPVPAASPRAEVAEPLPEGEPLKQVPLWDDMAADSNGDPLYEEAVKIVREMRRASTSLLQRRMRIGYTRAARLMDRLEENGIIGPAKEGAQAREVLDYGELAAAEQE
jgi:S-DNA-T family DNA segregation ATPase FtsK/SpoIIIE